MVEKDIKNGVKTLYAGLTPKKAADLKTSAATRQPGADFKPGDIITFPSKVDIYSETRIINGEPRTFDSTPAVLKRGESERLIKFMQSWAGSPDYQCYGNFPTASDAGAAVKAGNLNVNAEGTHTSNEGDLVESWHECATQDQLTGAIGGKSYSVEIIDYYVGQYNATNPRPRFRFTEVG